MVLFSDQVIINTDNVDNNFRLSGFRLLQYRYLRKNIQSWTVRKLIDCLIWLINWGKSDTIFWSDDPENE